MTQQVFLPERLRPAKPVRRRRRGVLLLALLPAVLLLAPLWTLQAVELDGCEQLPGDTRLTLTEMVGNPLFSLNLEWVRRQLEVWPCVSEVDVYLELPGVLHVRVEKAEPVASVPVARGWHGVTDGGRLAGQLEAPHGPLMIGFPLAHEDLRQGLVAAQRMARSSGATVEMVRRITPGDLEIRMVGDRRRAQRFTVHVRPRGSRAENRWCELARAGRDLGSWADLRWDHRMVVTSGGVG